MSFLNNAKWLAFAQAIKILCQLVSLIFLARIIPPNEYGLMSMAGVVVALGFLFRDMGTSAALIQKENLTEDLKNAVFWLNVLTGLILCISIIVLSPFVAIYFNEAKLTPVLALLSLTFLITCFSSSHLALMERQSKFKIIALIESFSSILATVFAIIAAYKGAGVYSLVIQSLFNSLISSILIFKYSTWIPSLRGYRYLREIKQLITFSGNLVAFNFVNYFSRNSDRYIVGRFMNSSTLGAYDLAYKIMLFPLQTLTFVISRSMLPILSSYRSDTNKFNETFINSLKTITFLSFPLMTGLMILREPFINLVLGSKWQMVTGILLWLAPTGMLQSINSTTGAVFTAKGKTHLLLYTGVMSAVIYVTCFLLSARYDIETFSKNYFISNVIAVGINLAILCFFIKLPVSNLIKALMPALIPCFLMWAILECLKEYFTLDWVGFLCQIFIGIVSYLVFYVLIPNNFIMQHIIKKRAKR